MVRRCIYCDTEKDLSKSDIIPDALTNAKIINPNVCRVAHNNKFSDMFENEVIEKLAFVTNELDIKSSKGNRYASYKANVIVEGTEYSAKMSAETDLFNIKIMRSTDGKSLIGPIEAIKKINAVDIANVAEIDINQVEIEKRVSIDMSVFFGQAIHRLVAKIAFEWYCLNNSVTGKLPIFQPVIEFIVSGTGVDPVRIIENEEIYKFIFQMSDMGNHTLLSYMDKDGSVNILVSLFGIAIYNVKLCDSIIQECPYNVLFLTINLDAQRTSFKCRSANELAKEIQNSFPKADESKKLQILCPIDVRDTTITYKMIYLFSGIYQNGLPCGSDKQEETVAVIKRHLETVLAVSALTVRGVKRFVGEHKENIQKGIVLNPYGVNPKAVFMFYLIFSCGLEENQIHSFKDLDAFVVKKFAGRKIKISGQVCKELQKEIMSYKQYAKVIIHGAEVIEKMKFE
ncbi:hypothetical protein FMM75_10400 [Lachnospiraceae bacterium MD335]|nr:hypothetical protein [Lachnospiraceae bacterium MD335]